MKYLVTYIILLYSGFLFAQKSVAELLQKHNNESIPYITTEELNQLDNVVLLDAREPEEYNVSHLKDAIFVGYDNFNIDRVIAKIQNKDQKIIVYCSLGIRSEDIAEQLKNQGYTNVYNLFGGIFEWKNKGNTVYTSNQQATENVHAFSKQWSKWLTKGNKTYE